MVSSKQLKANRSNAKKSTGPRTPKGKARAAKNAVKHGILARTDVLAFFESQEEWDCHLAGIMESLAPQNYLEEDLCRQIALHAWRLRRVKKYERFVTFCHTVRADERLPPSQTDDESRGLSPLEASQERVKRSWGALSVYHEIMAASPEERIPAGQIAMGAAARAQGSSAVGRSSLDEQGHAEEEPFEGLDATAGDIREAWRSVARARGMSLCNASVGIGHLRGLG